MDNVSVYIHVPFCTHICTYCDFPKLFHNTNYVTNYLEALEKEIKSNYKNELVNTIYFGGGTPTSLDINELEKLLSLINLFKKNDNIEITCEANIENVDEDKLILLKQYGVNRISIGVQTFKEKYLNFLGRKHNSTDITTKLNLVKKYFENINIDLMYAFPNQTIEELNDDLDEFIKLDIPHISTYSLIIEPHTVIYNKKIENIDQDLDASMYELIEQKLNKYNHYEVSNFSKEGYQSKHNLVYWNNNHYYGFGLGSGGYINNIRYTNTRNIDDYIKGNYILEQHQLDKNETIENEFILGLRKLKGINKEKFKLKYNIDISNIDVVKKLTERNELIDNKGYIYINPKMIYISNSILVEFIGEKYE